MRPEDVRPDLEQFVRDQFAFLIEERGFRLGPLEKTGWYTVISFLGERLGFDILLEFNDHTVIEGLINVQAGVAGNAGGTGASPLRRQRAFFGALQTDLKVKDKRVDRVYALNRTRQPWDSHIFEEIIQRDSELLRDYLDALENLPIETLFAPQT